MEFCCKFPDFRKSLSNSLTSPGFPGQWQPNPVWRNRPQPADNDPRSRPIIANYVDGGARDGAKLHFAEKPMKLSENKENENPLLAAQTTARRKGNPTIEKGILKAKSPGKNLETREGQTNSKPKEDYRSALQPTIIVSRKRREVEQKTVAVI